MTQPVLVEATELARVRSTSFDSQTWTIPGLEETWTIPVVHRTPAVCVLPVREGEDGAPEILLVTQPRPAAQVASLTEAPAGKVDPGETPETTVHRELEEETGYRAGRVERLNTSPWHVSPGYTDELMYAYAAYEITGHGQPRAEDAHITHRWIQLDQAVAMAMEGAITDMKTVAAILVLAIDLGTPKG